MCDYKYVRAAKPYAASLAYSLFAPPGGMILHSGLCKAGSGVVPVLSNGSR